MSNLTMIDREMLFKTVLLIAMVFLISIQGCSPGKAKAEFLAEVVESKGKVTVNSETVTKGVKLKIGDTVEVGRDSLARIRYLKDDFEINLFWTGEAGGSSICTISPVDPSGGTFVVNLAKGFLTFFVKPSETRKGRLEIHAADSVTAIYQTMGKIHVDEIDLLVAVARGKVGTTISGREFEITAGNQLEYSVSGGSPPKIAAYDMFAPAEAGLYLTGKVKKNETIMDGQGF